MPLVVHTLLIILCNVSRKGRELIEGKPWSLDDLEELSKNGQLIEEDDTEEKYICVFQMAGDDKGIAWEVLDVESHYPKELGGSLELSNDTFLSLRIKNVTSQNSGTYKCTLGDQSGEHNLSSTVTLTVTGCPGIEDKKLTKHKGELFMLTCLGIFYLLLIFFTCTCLRKESMSPNYQKTRPDMKHMLALINAQEMTTFQDLNSNSTCKNELTWSSV
ncbi:CD83 molecule [Willisornis vidua]|uniref:CD83 molecule n=1 Tax=Willisornis vidua TaxID=1566151 RepID=A0ABQ9CP05_9PASS|nr:CD83 molecule [Willisornis vidua]